MTETTQEQRDEWRDALESERPAIETTLRFVDERIAPRACDNEAVSACWRCQTVYLASVVRRALIDAPDAHSRDKGEA